MRTRRETAADEATQSGPSGTTGSPGATPLLAVDDLEVHFPLRGGAFDRLTGRSAGAVKAVDGVSFTLDKGKVLGVVGESGSGKTTLARAVLQMTRATAGSVRFSGQELTGLGESELRPLRREMQMIFQDPNASLNPAMDIGTAVGHPLRIHKIGTSDSERHEMVVRALETVGLAPVERFLTKFPADLSGGQKQRAVIARAIILRPALLVADEPVSMLDMSVRAKIMELMIGLKDDLDLTYLYITHDLATAKFFCDEIAIMYLGRVVEIGPPEAIYGDPKHPYTRALLRAIPEPDPRRSVPRDLPRGEIPDAASPPSGCAFHPRCPQAFAACGWESRDLRSLLEVRWTSGGEEVFDAERPLVGDLDTLDAPTHSARLDAGRGHTGTELAEVLDRARSEDADEPLWRGVVDLTADDRGVTVEFEPGSDPILTQVGAVRVACHLHDDNAERAREQGVVVPTGPATG